MILKIVFFLIIFISGELLINNTFFKYLKNFFEQEMAVEEERDVDRKFLGFHLSTFKGLFERFIIFLGLCTGFTTILAVFGALKIGTKLDKSNRIKNDYFLIGNFASILFCMIYFFIYQEITKHLP